MYIRTIFKQLSFKNVNYFIGNPVLLIFPLLLKQSISLLFSVLFLEPGCSPLRPPRPDVGPGARGTAGRSLRQPRRSHHLFLKSWREKVVMSSPPHPPPPAPVRALRQGHEGVTEGDSGDTPSSGSPLRQPPTL